MRCHFFRNVLSRVLLVLVCFIYAACEESNQQVVTAIEISQRTLTLDEGSEAILTVSHTPSELSAPEYKWVSDNTKVVTVVDGHITALSEGFAVVAVSNFDLRLFSSCKVTVVKVIPTSLTLTTEKNWLNTSETITIKADVLPENVKDKSVTWRSQNENVAKVDDMGNVTGFMPGIVTIEAQTNLGRIKASYDLEVKKVNIESVSLSQSCLTLVEDQETKLNAIILPENATFKELKWTSSDERIAIVSPEGVVKAQRAGKATIKVESKDGGKTASCDVIVEKKNRIDYEPYDDEIKW